MCGQELEQLLEVMISMARPTARDLRDALFEYWVVISRASLPSPIAADDEPALRRWLWRRLDVIWLGMGSSWDDPAVPDLRRLRSRLEQLPEAIGRDDLARVRQRLDELALLVVVHQRLVALARHGSSWRLLPGGGETSPPRRLLRVVAAEAG